MIGDKSETVKLSSVYLDPRGKIEKTTFFCPSCSSQTDVMWDWSNKYGTWVCKPCADVDKTEEKLTRLAKLKELGLEERLSLIEEQIHDILNEPRPFAVGKEIW